MKHNEKRTKNKHLESHLAKYYEIEIISQLGVMDS